MNPEGIDPVSSPDYEYLKCTATITTDANVSLTFSSQNLKHGKFQQDPVSNIGASSTDVVAYIAQGRSNAAEGTAGTVIYTFQSIFGDSITLTTSFNVPDVGANTASAGITGNNISGTINGRQGSYKCSYSYKNGSHDEDCLLTVTLSLVWND
jgi:hypothetical protein